MTTANSERTYEFKALTDVWTGSVTLEEKNGQIKEKTGPDRLITTGLLGSIRWWFEVLVRGLARQSLVYARYHARIQEKSEVGTCPGRHFNGFGDWKRRFS